MTQMVHPKMGFYTILHNISIIIHSRDLFFILTFVNIFLHFITPALFTSTSHLSSCTLNWVTNSLIDSMLSSSHLLRMTRTGYTYTTLPHPTCSTKLVPGVRHNVLPLLLALPHVTAGHVHLTLLPRQLVHHLLPNTRLGGQLEQGRDRFLLVLIRHQGWGRWAGAWKCAGGLLRWRVVLLGSPAENIIKIKMIKSNPNPSKIQSSHNNNNSYNSTKNHPTLHLKVYLNPP